MSSEFWGETQAPRLVKLKVVIGEDFRGDIDNVSRIVAVPKILEVICRLTGMGFAAVARVTEQRWVACSVLDRIDFGLVPGGELDLETTICHEIRQAREAVFISHVAEDDIWRNHATPARYGFQSYISVPIILADGSFFGTLCAIDPRPARLSLETVETFRLFTALIAAHLDANAKLMATESALAEEHEVAELREQFIAVLAHDLRTPVRAFGIFSELLQQTPLNDRACKMVAVMRESASRMNGLIDNLLDLARGRRGGLTVSRDAKEPLEPTLREVMAELQASHADRRIEAVFSIAEPIACDRSRVAQLFSNLLSNALTYGAKEKPVRVTAESSAEGFALCVANAGRPIPEEAQAHLFKPFYRSAVLQNREGLGLGLYIAHEIAAAHGGTLEVKSTAEETCFTFQMPV